jgi:hypothetical protein
MLRIMFGRATVRIGSSASVVVLILLELKKV